MLKLTQLLLLLILKTITSCATDQRIVGGRLAKLGEFPYQVSLRRSYNDVHFCGGTVISPKYILTAAHCCFYAWGGILPPSIMVVVAGQLFLNSTSSTYRNASRILIHPEYNSNTMANDIAVIELDEELPSDNKVIAAIGLNDQIVNANLSCTVSGWGVLNYGSFTLSNQLLATNVYTLGYEECQDRYDVADVALSKGMLCAVNDERPADACQGDSGGPLVCVGFLTGVISTGKGCANNSFPGIYTDVRLFLPWIDAIIGRLTMTEATTQGFPVLKESTTAVVTTEGWTIFHLFSSSTVKKLQNLVASLLFLSMVDNLFS